MSLRDLAFSFFFFNDTATTEIYTLSLHDALPICPRPRHARRGSRRGCSGRPRSGRCCRSSIPRSRRRRSEEHTSELQSHLNLVCRLLLEKKKKNTQLESSRESLREDDSQSEDDRI